MKTCAVSFCESALSWYGRIARHFCLVLDDRNLLPLIPHPAPLQGEHHIRGADKVALVLFPADAAFAVTQADKLLLHAPAAVWTPFLAQNGPPFLFFRIASIYSFFWAISWTAALLYSIFTLPSPHPASGTRHPPNKIPDRSTPPPVLSSGGSEPSLGSARRCPP